MTVAAGSDDDGLTIGEVSTYLAQVKVPVRIGGLVMQYGGTIQLGPTPGEWTIVEGFDT